MNQARQLAAIMYTDIVGYTAMMQANEQKAVAVIKHYNSTLEKLAQQFNGQVLNYYGDGSLCIYPSATDALNCSLALQKELKNEPAVLEAANKTADQLANLTWQGFVLNLVPVTFGNIIGGAIMVAAVYWFVYLRKGRD